MSYTESDQEEDGRNAHDERSPLLQPRQQSDDDATQRRYRRRCIILCILLIVLIELGDFLQVAPLTRIMEENICRHYYLSTSDAGPVDERRCKIEPVQSKLALLQGWQATFDRIPSIILALPYGIMGDKVGRKPTLATSLLGIILSQCWVLLVCRLPDIFNMRMLWFGSLFIIIGGGSLVSVSMIYTILSDLATEAERTATFLQVGAATLLAEIFASPAASIMMQKDPWVPVTLGLSLIIIGATLTVILLPETLHMKDRSSAKIQDQPDQAEDETSQTDHPKSLQIRVRDRLRKLTHTFHFMSSSRETTLIVMAYFVAQLARSTQPLLLQYTSKRYDWSIAQAGFLISYRAMINFVTMVVLLPALGYVLLGYFSGDVRHKDLWLARASVTLLSIGFFIIALAPVVPVMLIGLTLSAMGYGFAALLRSLATSLVLPHHVAILYNALGTSDATGSVIAGPMLSSSFKAGLRLGGGWIGLPFLIVGGLFAISAFGVIVGVRLRVIEGEDSETQASQDVHSEHETP